MTTTLPRPLVDLLPALLFAVALASFTLRLEVPNTYIYDEVYHAYTAGQYVQGNADAYVWDTVAPRPHVAYMWNHPPLGVLLIASGILIYGDTSYGWRFASAVCGAAGIALAYLLALRLTRRRGASILAACLLLMDGLYFVQSRTAMLDVFLTVFMMAALFALYAYLTAPPERSAKFLLLTGVFLGLAIATKWSAAYPAAIIGCIVLWRTLTTPAPSGGRSRAGAWNSHLRPLGLVAGGLVAIPGVLYLAAYIPFFATGHSFGQFVELQKQILYYHSHLRESHPYQSHWWQWPLALRPVWYYVNYLGDRTANIYTNGNPVLCAAFVPAVVALGWWRRRDPGVWVLLTGFLGQWLPWALVPRIAFAYHFLPATPFGCIAVAVILDDLYRRGTLGRICCIGYVAAVAASFAFFYPIYAAVPLSKPALEWRFLLPSWR